MQQRCRRFIHWEAPWWEHQEAPQGAHERHCAAELPTTASRPKRLLMPASLLLGLLEWLLVLLLQLLLLLLLLLLPPLHAARTGGR